MKLNVTSPLFLVIPLLAAIPLMAQPPTARHLGRGPAGSPRSVRDYSWIYIDAPEPHVVQVNDIVTILVDEKAEATLNSRFNRQRNSNLKAELKEFIRISERQTLENAAENQPTIDGNITNRMMTTGQSIDAEGIRFRIAATVADVLPNGNIVLEARKAVHTPQDEWEYRLTGVIRSGDINSNNTALSENIANLQIEKIKRGKVHDSTKRSWGTRLYDLLWPF